MTSHVPLINHNDPRIVKSPQLSLPGLPPASMIHHKEGRAPYVVLSSYNIGSLGKPYGVSQARRVLSPQLLLKRFDQVRDCLERVLGLTTAQREAILRLLIFQAYYPNVYPKESALTLQPGCSKSTFWRTVKILEGKGLVKRINRFFLRPHAQTSNLYRFDRLLLLIARYLAEHGAAFYQAWLKPYLAMSGAEFWPAIWSGALTPDAQGAGAPTA